MDETSIRLHQAVRCGHLTTSARLLKRSARALTSSATTAQTRGMCTLVAFVSDKREVQDILPQVLLVNGKHLSKAEPAAALRMHLDANTVLWTASKAWVTSTMMCKIVKLLHKHLAPYQDAYHFILTADGYRAHLTRDVWRTMNRTRVMYHLIPAKMTWALQPCDTHVFAVLKDTLRRECQRLALSQQDGRLTLSLLLQALARCIASVLRGVSWRSAFWDVGLTGVQATLSDRVLEKLDMRERPRISHDLPSLTELQCVFPARSVLPIDDIFGWFTMPAPMRVPDHAVAAAAAINSPSAVHPLRPWLGRTRSGSSLALPDPEQRPPTCPPPEMSSPAPTVPPPPLPRLLPRGRRLLPWAPLQPRLPAQPPP